VDISDFQVLCVCVLISVLGQLNGSSESYCGPFHQSVDVESVVGSIFLEMRSTRFDRNGTCLHEFHALSSRMLATFLPTRNFHLFGGSCIHLRTMELYVHMWDTFIVMLRAPMAFLYRWDNNVAAQSSNLGNVIYLSDSAFDVEQRGSQDLFLLLSVEGIKRHAPYARSLLSQIQEFYVDSITAVNIPC